MNQEVSLESINENIMEPIFAVSSAGTINFANPRFLDITQLGRSTLIGAEITVIDEFVNDGFAALEEAIDTVSQGASEGERVELEMTHPDSAPVPERLPAEARVTPLLEDGSCIGALVVLRDISTRKARERELQRQNDRLDNFASIVSHDLRNPLNVAQGRLDLVRLESESEHLDTVSTALDRMETLIEDMLTLARSGESVGEVEVVELAGLVEDCWQNVETGLASVITDTDGTVHANRTRLQQLVENLIRNAVEHGPADVTVRIGDLPGGFYVEDDGPGIPREQREEVLEPGFSTTGAGSGFGLSIVRDIAQAHGWRIAIAESSDGGARFEFSGVETE